MAKDKYEQAYDLLNSNVLVDRIQIQFDFIKLQLSGIQQRLETAKKHGLGKNLLAHAELQNIERPIGDLHGFLGRCLEQIGSLK